MWGMLYELCYLVTAGLTADCGISPNQDFKTTLFQTSNNLALSLLSGWTPL